MNVMSPTVLVDEHAERNSVGVEAIKKVLHIVADEGVKTKLLFEFDDTLGHSGHYVIVPVPNLNQDL